jgi:hypothetical protein
MTDSDLHFSSEGLENAKVTTIPQRELVEW